ncbi:MAG: RNB domain-containing ribonuclease [Candidatus Latescibacteria bacterium]|nr:RNB domain-containing ribonuclease [Candidatus Latescibacterota bacterium]
MDLWNKEITVANRFIYYYANFVKRVYGFVIQREGDNVPDEHYVGHFAPHPRDKRASRRRRRDRHPPVQEEFHRQGDPKAPLQVPKGRWQGTPETNEIVLFRYRKRPMLGYCQELQRKTLTVVAEDRRCLTVRRRALIYLTGAIASDDSNLFRTYAASVRALSSHIDLEEVWEIVREDGTPLSVSDIGSLYWDGEIDASRWAALCMHLEAGCPHFTADTNRAYLPLASEEVRNRKHALEGRKALDEEWDEFLNWLASGSDEAFDPGTLTEKQLHWLEQIRQFALWGDEARDRKQARAILAEASPGSKSRQRRAFELLASKGVWSEDENLDLIRSEIPVEFTDDVLRDAHEVDLGEILKHSPRRRLRWRRLFSLHFGALSHAALSLRRTWTGGYELGVHIPDAAAMVPKDSALDRAASDRMATIELPDRTVSRSDAGGF